MPRARILLVDRDEPRRAALRVALGGLGCDVALAATAAEAMQRISAFEPEAILAAAGPPPADGVAVVRAARQLASDAAVVVLADNGALDDAVAALREGADSYLVRPFDAAQAAVVLDKALERRRLRRERAQLRDQVRQRHVIVGTAPELLAAQEVIRRAAPTKATVLVVGETGSGRGLLAQAIHEASPRREGPFVGVSCAGISESLLECDLFGHEAGACAEAVYRREGRILAADGGTLFLHEVAQLSLALQIKLLRVLQHGELERVGGSETIRADVRVVASSSRDLAAEVHAGRFRDDLYYRLNVVTVAVPPLRKRKGDIPALVDHFVSHSTLAREKEIRGVSPGALSALYAYDWPGNVRELENAVERAIERCDGREIAAEHLSPVLCGSRLDERTASALIPGATLFEIEREAILRTLDDVGGSTTRAAEVLGISVRKIQYRLKEYRAGHAAGRRRLHAAALPKLVGAR